MQGITNDAWIDLIERHSIIDRVNQYGAFAITARDIKRIREPRLMTKFDAEVLLPDVFIENALNILPLSRSEFVIGRFLLYEPFPPTNYQNIRTIALPEFESISLDNITTEANAINALLLSRALDDFLQTDENYSTFNGRMGGGTFSFKVNEYGGGQSLITTTNPQIEIDAGLENSESIVIIEAKNVLHDDFIIRQLYFPYRTWREKVEKPIRLVFSVYSNRIFRLLEYRFNELDNYSSIQLVSEGYYSLDNTAISLRELQEFISLADWIYEDDMDNETFIFPQANSMERLFSLLEVLKESPRTTREIAEIMEFHLRQSDYYYNLGAYLGLMEKFRDDDGKIKVKLSDEGVQLIDKNYRERTFGLIGRFIAHKPFNVFFKRSVVDNQEVDKTFISEFLLDNNVIYSRSTASRRASTVVSILYWLRSIVTDV